MSETNTVSPLRQRMIEDMAARTLTLHTQRSHISSCKRFAAWLKRSPDTATLVLGATVVLRKSKIACSRCEPTKLVKKISATCELNYTAFEGHLLSLAIRTSAD